MSEFLSVTTRLEGDAPTVEGRLADIISEPGCVVQVDEYKLSPSDQSRVIRALRVAAALTELSQYS